jgi:hypothetical protein
VKALDEPSWPDFAQLVERHNGVWGGCWCMSFHPEGVGRSKTAEQNRDEKALRVREGRAHAALVYDGDRCVGWCQFGSPDELTRIKRQRDYRRGLTVLPEWRITCFPADRDVKVWDSYVENRTPGAWRIFWQYGPDEAGLRVITVLYIGPHP